MKIILSIFTFLLFSIQIPNNKLYSTVDEVHESNSIYYHMIDYSRLEDLNIQLPYVYEYSNDTKSILVFGSYHTSNPKDKLINNIESRFNLFEPDIVLYEGDGISFESTADMSIRYYFEMGFVRYLCNEKQIIDTNLEPSSSSKYEYLLKKYSKYEVFLADIGSQISLLLNSNINYDSFDFKKKYNLYIKNFIDDGFPITDLEKDIDYFYKIYKSFYGIEFNLRTFDYKTVEVKYNSTVLNKINQESAKYRDIYMLKMVKKLLSEYNRIYIQIGGRHAIIWEPFIKNIISNYSNSKRKK